MTAVEPQETGNRISISDGGGLAVGSFIASASAFIRIIIPASTGTLTEAECLGTNRRFVIGTVLGTEDAATTPDVCRGLTNGATSIVTGVYFGLEGTTNVTVATSTGSSFILLPPSKKAELRERLRKQMTPEIITKNGQLWGIELTAEEMRARSLLYDLVGDRAFRRYLKRGFIMVEGKNGTLYKISGGHHRIVSYVRNTEGKYEPFESYCVVFKDWQLPFTDGVIMRKLLVENDEFALRKLANVNRISKPSSGNVFLGGNGNLVMAG